MISQRIIHKICASALILTTLILSACGLKLVSREQLLQGIHAGTLPHISLESTLYERKFLFITREIILKDKVAELRDETGEAVLRRVGEKNGFPIGESIENRFIDPESITILGEHDAAQQGRVRYTISAQGGRGASFGPCANMREILLIDGKALIDAPYQHCRQLKAK